MGDEIVYQDKPHTIWYVKSIDKYYLTSPEPDKQLWSTEEWVLKEEIENRKKKTHTKQYEQLTLF